ncbi:MAG: hypothetical protein FWF86_00070 [Clostridia bacterium]|nr:hypothetical protein [Clostridia bacterium]
MKRIAVLFLVLLLIPIGLGAGAEASDPAGIKAAVEGFLTVEMERQASLAATEWERYLYAQGVAEVDVSLAKFDITKEKPLTVNFLIASGQPDLKNRPPYQGDPAPFLQGVVQSMGTRNVKAKLNLLITEQDGYLVSYAKGAEAALQKTVKGLATKAQKAVDDKKLLAALTDYLMPSPIIMPKKAPANLALEVKNLAYDAFLQRNGLDLDKNRFLGAMLYGIKDPKLVTTFGPEKLVLEYTVPFFSTQMQTTADNQCEELAYDRKAKEYTSDELITQYARQLEKDVVAYRYGKKTDVNETYQFSLLDLPKNLTPADFYQHETDDVNLSGVIFGLMIGNTVENFPDYPAIRNPSNGHVTGTNSGTKVKFQVGDKDEFNRCISVYDMSDRRISVTYLAAGKKTSVRIPEGNYYFVIGVGKAWYGPENLFGPAGFYQKMGPVEIKSKRWVHTYTFNARERDRGKPVDSGSLGFGEW